MLRMFHFNLQLHSGIIYNASVSESDLKTGGSEMARSLGLFNYTTKALLFIVPC